MNAEIEWKTPNEKPPEVAHGSTRRFMLAIYDGLNESLEDDWSMFMACWDSENGFHNDHPEDGAPICYRLGEFDRWVEIDFPILSYGGDQDAAA